HDQSNVSKSDFRDETLEARACRGRRTRKAEILIDDDDLIWPPTKRLRASLQVVLAGRALPVLMHLVERGLPNVQIRLSLQVFGGDFSVDVHMAGVSWLQARIMAAKTSVSSER